jgi:hypothetical protein
MTVGAADFALAQFTGKSNRTTATAHEPRNVVHLVSEVVKLQNDRIWFVAIYAVGVAQYLEHHFVVASICGDAKVGNPRVQD